MRQCPSKLRRPGLLAAAFAVALTALACAFALPIAAQADVDTSTTYNCAHVGFKSFDNQHLQDAVDEAANSGATLFMTGDWNLGDKLYVPEGKKVTVDMDGHRIEAGKCQVFSVHEKGELILTSSKKATFTYRGYSNEDGKECDYTVTTGGLITGKSGSINTIRARSNASITLDGVTIGGSDCWSNDIPEDNSDGGQGAVSLAGYATLNMKNGASIEHCKASDGVGVCVTGYWANINMDASSISNNWGSSWGHGGGVRAFHNSTIKMTGGSHVDNNHSGAGGGIYFSGVNITLTGDGTGTISGNKAVHSSNTSGKTEQGGGGIHVAEKSFYKNDSSLIENVTIANNYSAYDGGGIELDHANTKIKNCTIKDNWCKYEGGGAYVCDDGNTFENCTITGNSCSVDSGGNYEGGGIYVWHSYDVVLNGVCVIKGNTRGKGTSNPDDVFLREDAWSSTKAYITGNLAKGSSVGVRTGVTGDRRIAKNFKHETNDCLFYDMSGYYVSYGSDEGGDAWQRHTAIEFAVSIDGKAYGRYRDGSSVALAVPATRDDGKLFWRWDTAGTTGLYPVGGYITEKGALSNALAFTMPQNDVNLVPLYTDKVTAVRFQVEAPEAGRPLATAGKLWRSDGGASAESAPCSVYWYEVDEHGNASDTAAAGLAKANTAYRAYLVAPEAGDLGFFYDKEISAAVSLVSASGDLVKELEPDVIKTYLTLSNSLAAHVDDAYATGPGSGDVETGTVKVQMKNQGLLGGGEAAAAAMALDGDSGADAQAGSMGTVEVSYAYDEDTRAVTIAAPEQEGYNFCNWEVAGDASVSDEGAVTLPVSELLNIESLTAVYTPVVTKVEVEMDGPAPTAGEKLATSVDKLVLTGSDGSTLDLVKEIGAGSAAVTWSPEPEDGLAGYSTAYTALVELADADGLEDVEKVVASNAEVSVTAANGAAGAEAAGFTVVDGKLCLAVSFAKTDTPKAVSVEQPADVEVSFEDAAAGEWGLPKTVGVKLENGELAEGDVTWEAVEGFDANATTAQVLTAKGTVTHVTYDGELDTDGLDTNVTVTVKVAAPAKQADDAAKTETTTTTETKTKKGTPATGDVAFTGAAGLLAAAAVCLAAARVSRRNN